MSTFNLACHLQSIKRQQIGPIMFEWYFYFGISANLTSIVKFPTQ